MRSWMSTAMAIAVFVGCHDEPEELATSVTEAPVLWAACTAYSNCPDSENCVDVYESADSPGGCWKECDNQGSNCINRETCTSSKQYCCRSVWCIQNAFSDPDAKNYYVSGSAPECHTGVECEPCPAGRVRDLNDPDDPTCCTPSCSGKICGSDSCGWPGTCGTCPSGQTCVNAGTCCRRSKAQACGNKHCGTVSDGCGGTYTCGSCGSHQYCGTGNYCYCSSGYRNCGLPLPSRPQCYVTCP